MTQVEIKYDMSHLSAAMREYGRLSGKSEAEVIAKQSSKLGYNIWLGLRAIAPARGSVRAERLAALKAGQGIHVREAAYAAAKEKYGGFTSSGGAVEFFRHYQTSSTVHGLNFQALAVRAELGLRESGRGFAAWSTPRPRSYEESTHFGVESRYGNVLSLFDLEIAENAEHKFARFEWPSSGKATAGLNADVQEKVLDKAIEDTTADIMEYVKRKIGEDLAKVGLI